MPKGESRLQKTVKNTVMGVINQFSNVILSFVLRTVFIYTLGIQYTGVSSVFTDILTMLSLSELGVGTAIATALYKPLHDNDQSKIRKLMFFYRQAYRWIALFIMLLGIILVPFLDIVIKDVPDIHESIEIIFIFYIIKTSVSYLLIYKSTLLNADQKQYVVKMFETVCTAVRYVLEIILLIIFKQYMLYLITEIIATILQNYVISKRVENQYGYAFEETNERLSATEKKYIYKDIKALTMFQLSFAVGNSIDNILISSFISTVTAGLFSNYMLIRKQLESIIKQFFNAVIPSIGSLAAEDDPQKQFAVFNRMFFISFVVTNFCATSYFVLIEPFISLWLDGTFLLESALAFIIAFDLFLYILLQLVASFRTANGIFVRGQYRPLITAVFNAILSVLMIQYYGITGTVLATVASRLLTQWYDPYLLYKYVFKRPFRLFYFKYWYYIFLFFCSCVITYKLSEMLYVESALIAFVWKIGCCMVIPNIWIIIFTMRSSEFRYAMGLCKKGFGKVLKINWNKRY